MSLGERVDAAQRAAALARFARERFREEFKPAFAALARDAARHLPNPAHPDGMTADLHLRATIGGS